MLETGEEIDIWVVEKPLGSGGMGSVYRCHNRSAKRILAAVKVLESSLRRFPEAEARFIREAEILFQLDHPNIVKVRNVRTDTDPPYLEMEFVEGESLEERLARGRIPLEEALPQMKQIASAVAYLHGKGVRHRDIKPANLLLTKDGRCKLVDFGLAMEADVTRLTQDSMSFGTVSYAPPEWISPEDLDPERWDLYAMGVVFWEMLTGHVAFPVSGQGSARQQAMQVIVGKQNQPELDPGSTFNDDLRELIGDLTMKDPAKRPASAQEVLTRIEALTPVEAKPGAKPRPVTPPPAARERGRPVTTAGDGTLTPSDTVSEFLDEEPTGQFAKATAAAGVVALGGGLGIALVSVVIVVAVVAVAVFMLQQASTRDVNVVVTGLSARTPVSLMLDNTVPASRDAHGFHFRRMQAVSTHVAWVVGKDCPPTACPGDACPAWCGTGTSPVEITRGSGVQTVPVALTPGTEAEVVVRLTGITEPWPIEGTLGTHTATGRDGRISFLRVPPGRHALKGKLGECPACTDFGGEVVVPWSNDGKVKVDMQAEPPEKKAKAKGAKTKGSKTKTKAATVAPQPSGTGSPVSNGQFAAWLATHPDWHAEAARAAGRADTKYLSGWNGTKPPGAGAAVNVSWYAAAAYCKGRGGLASVDAEPLRWSEGPNQPFLEWRVDGGRATWRSSDGRKSDKVDMKQTNPLTGFRCAR